MRNTPRIGAYAFCNLELSSVTVDLGVEYVGEYVLVANKMKYVAYQKLFGLGKQVLHVMNRAVKKRRT